MKKHGQITYELTEEEYEKIKDIIWKLKQFVDNKDDDYREDAEEGVYELDKILETGWY